MPELLTVVRESSRANLPRIISGALLRLISEKTYAKDTSAKKEGESLADKIFLKLIPQFNLLGITL